MQNLREQENQEIKNLVRKLALLNFEHRMKSLPDDCNGLTSILQEPQKAKFADELFEYLQYAK